MLFNSVYAVNCKSVEFLFILVNNDGRNVYVIDKNITFIKENYLNQYYGKKDSVIVYKDEKEFNGFTIYSG